MPSRRLLIGITACSLLGCRGDASGPGLDPVPTKLVIREPHDTLNALADTITLVVDALDQSGNKIPSDSILWLAQDYTLVTVSQTGRVSAIGVGVARVIAQRGPLADTTEVVVRQVFAKLALLRAADTVFLTDTVTLGVEARDSNDFFMPPPEPLTIAVADPSIASHDGGGVLRATGYGNTNISATERGQTVTGKLIVEGPFVSIVGGNNYSCGLVAGGAAYCWGWYPPGAIGTSEPDGRYIVRKVPGIPPLKTIAGGHDYDCGLAVDGSVFCWGSGYGATTRVPRAVAAPEAFVMISTGYGQTCAIAVGGNTYCWGRNTDQETGVSTANGGPEVVTEPTRIEGLQLREVSAGVARTCGVDPNGVGYCWGSGYGPTPTRFGGTRLFKSIGVGGYPCAILLNGRPYCPTDTTDFPTANIPALQRISAGNDQYCGIDTNGNAYCWGWNYFGELGNGTRSDGQQLGSIVVGGLQFSQIDAAGGLALPGTHTCGVTTDGVAYCWGANNSNQLSAASVTGNCAQYACSMVPVRVRRLRS